MQEQTDKSALLAEILPTPSNQVINHFDRTEQANCSGLCESPGGCKGIHSA